MLASPADLENLTFPKYISPKLDGVRAVVVDGVVLGRSLKPIRNQRVQDLFGRKEFNGLDGELIVGDPTAKDAFRTTSSVVNSVDKERDVFFHVFDDFSNPEDPFRKRMELAFSKYRRHGNGMLWVRQMEVGTVEEMDHYERSYLEQGYEGAMLRDPLGRYKFNRSTSREGILLKVKRFVDRDCIVVDFEELLRNGNEAKINELGLTERSSHKENKSGAGILGSLVVKDADTGIEFNIGTGFTQEDREKIWQERGTYKGKIAKYKSLPIGVMDKPRHPVFLGWRN
jgi:DNA ligase-1